MIQYLRVGIDGTLIRKRGKGVSRFLVSFLEAFALNPQPNLELLVFIAKGANLPTMPGHFQIRYVPVKMTKQVIWDLWGFERSLKAAACDKAFTLNDRVHISYKYLLYYFEVPDHRANINRVSAGCYQKISDQITKFFLKKTFAKADHIATSSAFTRDNLLNIYNIPKDRISIVYAAPADIFKARHNPDEKQRIRQKYKAEEGYILHFSSNNDPRDNTGRLLKAFSLLINRFATKYKLVICGVDELSSFGWGEVLQEQGLKERVVFAGFLSGKDLLEIYQGADVYVDPSLYEGFGYQVAEAMACGLPIICANTSSLPEIAEDAAVYFDHNSEQRITEAIISVVESKEKMREMSEKSIQQAKKFSIERTKAKIIELLRKN